MRIEQLRGREPLDSIMAASVECALRHHLARDVHVSDVERDGAQPWRMNPLLSVYFTLPLTRRARCFIADSFRYTSSRGRAILQWLLGTVLASRAGLRLAAAPAFWILPPVPAEDLVIMPGNRRIRIFDLSTRTTLVWAKPGFDTAGMRREIELRKGSSTEIYPPITGAGPDHQWFLEPLLAGRPLSRQFGSECRSRQEQQAVDVLNRFLAKSRQEISTADYVKELHGRLSTMISELQDRYNESSLLPAGILEELAARASRPARLIVARTHGDFQPGNVLVETGGDRIWILDWEYTNTRSDTYDLMVYALRARSPEGLGDRLGSYVKRGRTEGPPGILPVREHRQERIAAAALFLLEDLERAAEESLSGPFFRIPPDFHALVGESRRFSEYYAHGQSSAVTRVP